MIRFACIAAMVLALVAVTADQAEAQAPLFSQYTTQGAGSPSAGLYPAPYASPILGSESHYTYQPLMPHEMMYQHSRNYYNYYDAGYQGGGQGMVKTSVRWQAGNNHMGPLPFSTGLSGAAYRLKSRKYNIPSGGSSSSRGGNIGGRLRSGGFGCSNGTCDAEEAYSSDAYLGDQYQGESISGGCAGGCTANAGSNIQR